MLRFGYSRSNFKFYTESLHAPRMSINPLSFRWNGDWKGDTAGRGNGQVPRKKIPATFCM